MISMLISFPLVMTPIMWYFFILPLAETNLLGPSTFMITLDDLQNDNLLHLPH